MKRALSLIACLTCLLLSGCGGAGGLGNSGESPSRPAVTPGATQSGTPKQHTSSSADAAPRSSAGTALQHPTLPSGVSSANPESGPRASTPRLTVVLGAACVVPGAQQSIHLSTPGQASVSFNTHYADSKLGADYGGVGIGMTDQSGSYRNAWMVSSRAPLGTATIDAGMSSGGSWSVAPGVSFTVASHC